MQINLNSNVCDAEPTRYGDVDTRCRRGKVIERCVRRDEFLRLVFVERMRGEGREKRKTEHTRGIERLVLSRSPIGCSHDQRASMSLVAFVPTSDAVARELEHKRMLMAVLCSNVTKNKFSRRRRTSYS